jgi:hypothetical protein
MTLSTNHASEALFAVQSGIGVWEDLRPIADWKWKTITVISSELSTAVELLWLLVSSRPLKLTQVARFCTMESSSPVGRSHQST